MFLEDPMNIKVGDVSTVGLLQMRKGVMAKPQIKIEKLYKKIHPNEKFTHHSVQNNLILNITTRSGSTPDLPPKRKL